MSNFMKRKHLYVLLSSNRAEKKNGGATLLQEQRLLALASKFQLLMIINGRHNAEILMDLSLNYVHHIII